MFYRSLFAAALVSGLAFASTAEAGHTEPTIRVGIDMVWGGGYIHPAPVAWYPAPVYSYAPPPRYGRPYWAAEGRHRHHRHRHHHHESRHHDKRDDRDDRRHGRRGRDH